MTFNNNMVARAVVLIVCGFAGFILGMNYGCSFLLLLRERSVFSNPTPFGPTPSVDLAAETAQFTRSQRAFALQSCCAGYIPKIPLKRQDPIMLKTFIVDRKLRFLYCYVPKVASTNMKRLLLTLQGKATNPNAIKTFNRRGFEFLSDFNATEQKHILKTYFKFMFVRHPLERLVSAYRHRMIGKRTDLHEKYGKFIVKKYRNKGASQPVRGDDVTFREFVKYLLERDISFMDNHWKPFFDICQPCLIRYNFIGSMENLKFDVSALLEKLNTSKSVSFPEKQASYQSLTKEDALMFYRNVTHSELKRLRYKYGNDFKCFLYPRQHEIRTLPDEGRKLKASKSRNI